MLAFTAPVVLNSTLLSLRCAGSVQMFHDVSIHMITWKNLYHVDEGVVLVVYESIGSSYCRTCIILSKGLAYGS